MRLFRFDKNIGDIMIINSVIGKVDGLEIDLKLSDGVNFIFYTDKSERLLYEKIFRLAFGISADIDHIKAIITILNR